jgi:Major tropism determinant N-terminal domain
MTVTNAVRYRTHGPLADRTVEKDFEGQAFGINERGAIIPGTINASGLFVPDPAHRDNVYLVTRVQRDVDVLAGFAGLVNMERELFADIYFVCAEGATQAMIPCEVPQSLPDSSEGPILHILDTDTGIPRGGGYPVANVYGNTVWLVDPMSEEAPAGGALCILEAARKLRPRKADFPNPAVGFRGTSGASFVVDQTTGGIFRVTEGADLAKISSGSGACDLRVGWTDGNANIVTTHKRRGRWDDGAITGPLTSSAQTQLRRGTTDQEELFAGAVGELTFDTERKILVAGTGAAGGEPVAKLAQFSTTEHDTGQRVGAAPVYERSFVLELTAQVDASGNIGLYSVPHLISGLVFNHASKPVWLDATWHLGDAAAISGAYASVPVLGSSYMVVVDPGNISVAVTSHGLGALRLFLRLRYCRT